MSLKPSQRVINVTPLYDYHLKIQFGDEKEFQINLEPTLYGEVFEELKDKELFSQVSIDYGTICWPNGADIASDTLRIWCENGRVLSFQETAAQFI